MQNGGGLTLEIPARFESQIQDSDTTASPEFFLMF